MVNVNVVLQFLFVYLLVLFLAPFPPCCLRMIAAGTGADGVALAQFLSFLFASTYLLLTMTWRIDH